MDVLFTQERWVNRTVKCFKDIQNLTPYQFETKTWESRLNNVMKYYSYLEEIRPDEIYPKDVGIFHKSFEKKLAIKYSKEEEYPIVYVYDNANRFYGIKNWQVRFIDLVKS